MIHFEHQGKTIYNPLLSACGRLLADPVKDYGFFAIDTGGGCQALCKTLPNGCQIWLTDADGSHLPDPGDVGALIGYYNRAAKEVVVHPVPTPEALESWHNARFSAVWGPGYMTQGQEEVGISFFSAENGYSVEDQVAIARLATHEQWHASDGSNHQVLRLI